MRRPVLFLISAPSGGGKTTVCNALLAANPGLSRVITCTTRPPRPGEVNGVDYHFYSPEEFDRRVVAGEFLEQASVYERRYGTRKASVLDLFREGKDVLLNIDVQGAASVRGVAAREAELAAALVTVFLTPPTRAELEQRLRGRGSDSNEVIARRMTEAQVEVARWREFDYLVVSGTPAQDAARMQAILDAERIRSVRSDLEWKES